MHLNGLLLLVSEAASQLKLISPFFIRLKDGVLNQVLRYTLLLTDLYSEPLVLLNISLGGKAHPVGLRAAGLKRLPHLPLGPLLQSVVCFRFIWC